MYLFKRILKLTIDNKQYQYWKPNTIIGQIENVSSVKDTLYNY